MSIARYEQEQRDEATGVVEQYVEPDTKAPRPACDLNVLVERKLIADPNRTAGNQLDKQWAMFRIQELLMRKANFDKFERPVVLHMGAEPIDGDPDDTGVPESQRWDNMAPWHTARPRIAFISLGSSDVGLQELAGHPVMGAAVYFDPTLVGRIPVERASGRIDPATGKEQWVQKWARNSDGELIPMTQPDRFNASGYIAVVRFFSTIPQIQEAHAELARAVQVIDAPPVEEGEPDVEYGDLSEAENLAHAGDWNSL